MHTEQAPAISCMFFLALLTQWRKTFQHWQEQAEINFANYFLPQIILLPCLAFFFSFCKRILHLFPWELFYFVHQFSYVMSFHLKLPFAVKRLTWFKKVSESDCCLHFSITSQMTLCVLPWFCTSPILSDKHTVAVFLCLPCMSNGEKSLKFKVLNRKWWNGLSEIYIT